MRPTPIALPLLAILLLVSIPAFATSLNLIDMGDNTIFDKDTKLTWLKDAGLGGLKNWSDAMAWANDLSYAGFDDWRLPTTLQPDPSCADQSADASHGINCTGSEMGHLFYVELGNKGCDSVSPLPDCGLKNTDLFDNLQQAGYWSSTYYIPSLANRGAFAFYMDGGAVEAAGLDSSLYSWAVRYGERLPTVPEPTSFLLFGSGLGITALAVWRKKKSLG